MKFLIGAKGEPDITAGEVDPSWIRGVIVIANRPHPASSELEFCLLTYRSFNPKLFEELEKTELLYRFRFHFYVSDDPISEEGFFPKSLKLGEKAETIAGPGSSMLMQSGSCVWPETGTQLLVTFITLFTAPIAKYCNLMCPVDGPLKPFHYRAARK